MISIFLLILMLRSCQSTSLLLGSNLTLSWEVDSERREVVMVVEGRVRVMDWVGLGFSEYGETAGADMCVVWTDWRGNTEIVDTSIDQVSSSTWLKKLDSHDFSFRIT